MIDLSIFDTAVSQIQALATARAALVSSSSVPLPDGIISEIDASLQALSMWIHDVREAAMHPPQVQEDPLVDQIAV